MNDAKLTDCPEESCAGNVRRLLGTGAGIIFKGGGFYQTDYRNTSYNEAKKADKEPTADACSKCPHADKKSADKKPACAAKKSATAKSGDK